jgi:hypothetical protein
LAVSKVAPEKSPKESIPPAVIAICVVLALGVAGFFYLDRVSKKPPPPPPPLTGEARAYVKNLKLAGVEIKAHESYLKQSVVELVGNIGNEGDRTLKSIDLNCVFYDAYGQVVLRKRAALLGPKDGPEGPGQTKPFRLPFDDIPESWNQAMPQLVIAGITFQ